ncbi:MAG: hypothetical protein RBT63_03235 [Bdellovibrionales bacterium]|jgi:hypothetical protein|nr:hypothetical protein [Bdellovibrionales bacterium]
MSKKTKIGLMALILSAAHSLPVANLLKEAQASVVTSSTLECSFGFVGVPILMSKTELRENGDLGLYTYVAFQGTPARQVPNVSLGLSEFLYAFQLDEGFGADNITIKVLREFDASGAYRAVAENPQTPHLRKMNGSCVSSK